MTDILDKLSSGLLQRLMRLEWLLASLLVISFIDMYLNLKYGFSLTALLNRQKSMDLYGIVEAIILFFFILYCIFCQSLKFICLKIKIQIIRNHYIY